MGYYFSWEEDEANKLGHDDEKHHRSDYTHSKFAFDGEDRAYWEGREEEAKAEKRREEEREEEERQEREEQERIERRRYREAEEERQREQEDLREYENQYINDAEEEEYNRVMNEIAETPSTEQELFMQIEEDERRTQETKPDSN
jgi:uncharacterized protein with WD repeat